MATFKFMSSKDIKNIEVLEYQRELKSNPELFENIKKYGAIGSLVLVHSSFSGKRKLYLLDGHHRITYYGMLGIKFHVQILDDIDSKKELGVLMGSLNSTQKAWKIEDFIDLYKKLNIKDYSELKNFMDKYLVSASTAAKLLSSGSGGYAKAIKSGIFKVKSLKQAEETMKLIPLFPSGMSARMIMGIHRVRLQHDKFNPDKLAKAVKRDFLQLKAEKYDSYVDVFSSYLN